MNKKMIWSDINLDFDSWKQDLESEYPYKTENELFELMYELNGDYLNDERHNLNIELQNRIVIFAELGLWNKTVNTGQITKNENIKDCLYSNHDYAEWYVDPNGDLRSTQIHHDGTNYYLYRVLKNNVTDTQISDLEYKLYNCCCTKADISRLTSRLGDVIGNIYGWKFRGKTPKILVYRRDEKWK